MANSSISGGILPVKKAKDMWETGPIESKHQFQPTLCTHGRDQCAFHSHTVDGRQTHPCSISWGNQGCLSCRRGRGWQRNQQFDGPCAGWGAGLQIYSNKPRCKELHVHMFHHPNTAQSQPVSVSSLLSLSLEKFLQTFVRKPLMRKSFCPVDTVVVWAGQTGGQDTVQCPHLSSEPVWGGICYQPPSPRANCSLALQSRHTLRLCLGTAGGRWCVCGGEAVPRHRLSETFGQASWQPCPTTREFSFLAKPLLHFWGALLSLSPGWADTKRFPFASLQVRGSLVASCPGPERFATQPNWERRSLPAWNTPTCCITS